MSEVVCPSGLKIEVRGLKGKELKILQDRASVRSGTFVDKLLSACTTAVVDAGPYEFAGDLVAWDKVLIGDRLIALIAIRCATHGSEFSFTSQCPGCKKKLNVEADLSALPTKSLSTEDAAALRTGEPLSCKLPSDGRVVKFRLATGRDERLAAQAKNTDNAWVQMIAMRVTEIDGVPEGGVRKFLEELGLADLNNLRKEFDKRDCGVETGVEVECDECGTKAEVLIPLGATGYWLPS